ncbi:MAG: dienelactone hydrolase family protein [Chakrabartia sp.]
MKLYIFPAIAALFLAGCATPLLRPGEQRAVLASKASGYPYLMFVPKAATTHGKAIPLLIFLHGSGERGSDIEKVKIHGPPKRVLTRPDFPFVTVSPLLEADGDWDVEKLDAMLAQVRRKVDVDPARLYLTGLSRGGHATWRWAAARSGTFAAIAPIAGRGDVTQACNLENIPVWAFHGDKDNVVEPKGSSEMVDAINACGGSARVTIYSDTGHDSWTRTYDNPALYAWLLAQHKNK